MKKFLAVLWLAPFLFMAMISVAQAGGSGVAVMAGIAVHLNHYPTDSEKKTLKQIAQDDHATAGEKALAGALMRMQHQVGGTDVKKLRALMADDHASDDEKTLADVLLGINHKATAKDKQRLQALGD
jgi:hypothetical protein